MVKKTTMIFSFLLLASCATTPTGPTNVTATAGPHKTALQFSDDNALCQQTAASQTGSQSTHDNWVQAGIAGGGMLLGAGLGAALGGGRGAAIGAAGGALAGTTGAGVKAGGDQRDLQERYNGYYVTCMTLHGNRIS